MEEPCEMPENLGALSFQVTKGDTPPMAETFTKCEAPLEIQENATVLLARTQELASRHGIRDPEDVAACLGVSTAIAIWLVNNVEEPKEAAELKS